MTISPPPRGAPAPLTRAQARLVWSALAFSLASAFVASALAPSVLRQPANPELAKILLPIVALVTAMDLALAYVVTASMRRRAGGGGTAALEAAAGTQVILASGLAFGAALFSCVAHFITGEWLFLLLVLPCAAVLLHWFPSESRWARIGPAAAGGAAPARRMMRE